MKFLRRYPDEKEPTLKTFAKVVQQEQRQVGRLGRQLGKRIRLRPGHKEGLCRGAWCSVRRENGGVSRLAPHT